MNWGPKRAAAYDERTGRLFPAYGELHAAVTANTVQLVPPGSDVLVLGAGTGRDALELARVGYRVLATDPSEDMLDVAREKARGVDAIAFRAAKVEELPQRPQYGGVVSVLVWHFLKDDGEKLEFVKEAHMRTKPGGALILADLCGDAGSSEFHRQREEWFSHLESISTPEEYERDRDTILANVHFIGQDRHLELLTEAGWISPRLAWRSGLLTLWVATKPA